MAVIYRDLIANDERTRQVIADVTAALGQGRNCLVLTNWTGHLETLASRLREPGPRPGDPARRHGRQEPRRRAGPAAAAA